MNDRNSSPANDDLGRAARAVARAERLVVHVARSFREAEEWDLAFWQSLTPQERLTAFVHQRRAVELTQAARGRFWGEPSG